MFLIDAYVEIHAVKNKSLVCLVGYHETDNKKFPKYMVTSSLKSFQKMFENKTELKPKEGMKLKCDIALQKDDHYRTWLVFKRFDSELT